MSTHVSTPSRSLAQQIVASIDSPAGINHASARKAQVTGKGSSSVTSARGFTNSRFKQKAALATRTSPKTPLVRASKRNTPGQGVKERKGASPPPARAMLTPGAIKQMRQSANGSILGASRVGTLTLAAEPSFEKGLANTSSILSENSTLTVGSVDEPESQRFSIGLSILGQDSLSQRFSMGLSILGRDSLDSVRNPNGSVRDSSLVPFSALVSTQDAAWAYHYDASLLESRFVELQTENSELRSQLESYKVCASSFGPALFSVPRHSLASYTHARLLKPVTQHAIQLYPWFYTCQTVHYCVSTLTLIYICIFPHARPATASHTQPDNHHTIRSR